MLLNSTVLYYSTMLLTLSGATFGEKFSLDKIVQHICFERFRNVYFFRSVSYEVIPERVFKRQHPLQLKISQ